MLGDLQREKLERLFQLVDVDNSGSVEFSDMETLMQRTLDAAGHAPDSDAHAGATVLVRLFWESFKDAADTNQDGQISPAEWMACWERLLSAEQDVDFSELPALVRQAHLVVSQALGISDRKGADLAAYRRFLAPYGASLLDKADEHFVRLDLDGSGTITADELQQLTAEFFLSNEDAPGNVLFG